MTGAAGHEQSPATSRNVTAEDDHKSSCPAPSLYASSAGTALHDSPLTKPEYIVFFTASIFSSSMYQSKLYFKITNATAVPLIYTVMKYNEKI